MADFSQDCDLCDTGHCSHAQCADDPPKVVLRTSLVDLAQTSEEALAGTAIEKCPLKVR